MFQTKLIPSLNLMQRRSNLLVIFFVSVLFGAYFVYIKRQYVDIIFESQFLHIEFLNDISKNQLSFKNFFTVFGEHLFPGYNLILAVNYYLFDLWGGFDSVVYAFNLLIAAIFVIIAVYRSAIDGAQRKTLIILVSSFLLLSPTNNPQWGMALASAIGVTLFLITIFNVSNALDNNLENVNPITYIALAFAIIFFLGGYAVGAVASVFLLLCVSNFHRRVIDKNIIVTLLVIFISLIVYIFLVNKYGALLVNKPTGETINFQLITKFLLLMVGSGLLGKAFFELTQQFLPYYICGAILLFWSICLFNSFIKKPTKGRLFFLGIATYSVVNILAVSFFRFKNGLDGAMGQWYNVHTHFVAVAVCFYLISSLDIKNHLVKSIFKMLSLSLVFFASVVGYYCDWKKSEHVPGWKNTFVSQAPVLLAFPDLIQEKGDPLNTMLWDYPSAKSGVDFLYSNNLWIFKKNTPLIFGLSSDGWMEANRSVMIICPPGSIGLNFHAWRPDAWPQSIVSARYTGQRDLVAMKNDVIQFAFTEGKPAVLLNANDFDKSNPVVSNGDDRKLVAIINKISCNGLTVQSHQNNVFNAVPSVELKVRNWGPQSSIDKKNPNEQPDGSMGIWIEVSGLQELGEAQVVFDGKPAKSTSIQEELITASITANQLAVSGEKEIFIRQIGTGRKFPVGIFKVVAP